MQQIFTHRFLSRLLFPASWSPKALRLWQSCRWNSWVTALHLLYNYKVYHLIWHRKGVGWKYTLETEKKKKSKPSRKCFHNMKVVFFPKSLELRLWREQRSHLPFPLIQSYKLKYQNNTKFPPYQHVSSSYSVSCPLCCPHGLSRSYSKLPSLWNLFVPLLHISSWYIIVLRKLKKKMVVGLLSEYTMCPSDQKLPQSGGSAFSAALVFSHRVVFSVRGPESQLPLSFPTQTNQVPPAELGTKSPLKCTSSQTGRIARPGTPMNSPVPPLPTGDLADSISCS